MVLTRSVMSSHMARIAVMRPSASRSGVLLQRQVMRRPLRVRFSLTIATGLSA